MLLRTSCVAAALSVLGLFFVFSAGQAMAQASVTARDTVGVLDFEPAGATRLEALAVSDRVRSALLDSGRVTLVDRSQLDAVINEQALQQSGCTSQECAIKVGKVLGVRKLVSGRLIKISDGLWQVSALLVDVETAETLKVASITQEGNLVAVLNQCVPQVASTFFAQSGRVAAAVLPARVLPAPAAAAPGEQIGDPRSSPAAPVPVRNITIAVYPWIHVGYNNGNEAIAHALTAAVQETPGVRVAYTVYPEETPGKALRDAKELRARSRSGTFTRGPNVPFLTSQGADLKVQGILLLDTDGGSNYSTAQTVITASAVSVPSGKVYTAKSIIPSNINRKQAQERAGLVIQDALFHLRDGG